MNDPQPPPDERPTLAKDDDRRTRPYPQPPHQPPPPAQAGPSPYEQVPYQQPYHQPGFGPPGHPGHPGPYGPGYAPVYVPPKHPQATTALVLGLVAIIGGFMCLLPAAVAPWAWSSGARAVKEIDASGGQLGGRGEAQAGYVMGIIGTVLLGLGLVFVVLYLIVVIGMFGVLFAAMGS